VVWRGEGRGCEVQYKVERGVGTEKGVGVTEVLGRFPYMF
jgi:hypothetical protein